MKFGKEYFEFSKNQHGFDMRHKGDWQKEYAQYFVRIFCFLKGKKSLDFGCAMGSNTVAMKEAGFDIEGIDVSQDYIDLSPFKNQIKLSVFDCVKLPYEDNTFGFVHSQQVLEHIDEETLVKVVFPEIFRVMKPGGYFYAATPFGHDGWVRSEKDDPTHVSCLSTEKWERIAREAGFQIATSQFIEKWKDEPMLKAHGWHQMVFRKPTVSNVIPVQTNKDVVSNVTTSKKVSKSKAR